MGLRIGYRTIKTAIGTAISILIAQQLGLEFYASAGIITILCVQVTRKKSFRTSVHRILACLLGLLFGFLFYNLIGYNPLALCLLILTFIPVTVRFKINEGFVSSAVILLHIYSAKRMDWAIVFNELTLLTIGVTVALLMNLYMPNVEKDLKRMQARMEANFAKILKEFSYYLRYGDRDWDGKEMIETAALLEEAIQLAFREVENRFLQQNNTYYQYFVMRSKQLELLERMLPSISSLNVTVPQGEQIADFLENLSENVHGGNTAYIFLDKLYEMREEIRQTALPQTKEELEIRAALYYLLQEIEQYLFIKQNMGKSE